MPRLTGAGASAVLRQRNFRWFFLARVVSTAGTALTSVALAFAVLAIGTPADLGLVMAASSVSMIVFILIGGVVADRLPRQAVIQVTWTVAGLCQVAVATLLFTRTATIPAIAAVEAVAGAATAFTAPALQGLIPQVTDRRYLQEADSLMAFARSSLMLVGPVLSGLIVAGPGPEWALIVDGASYFLAAACYTQVRVPRATLPPSTILKDLATGWSEFTRHTWLWSVVLAFGLGNAMFSGALNVVGPSVAATTPGLGASGWGLVLAAMAVGVLLTTVLLMRIRIERPLLVGLLACALEAVPVLALALSPTLPVLMASTAVVGAAIQVFATGWNVSLQEHVPQESLSRVVSYDFLGSFVLGPLGLACYGWAAGHVDVRRLLLWTAAALVLIQLAPLTVSSTRRLARLPVEEGAPGTVPAP